MKVLEEKPWTVEAKCKECGSTLLVEATDVKAVEYESGDCDYTSYSAQCAVCKSDVELKLGDIASGVREAAVRRYRQGKKRRW